MNIVVCVKYVPDAQADRRFDETTLTTDRVNVEGLLSELDEYAVEEALKLVEANEGEVTVVTIGPDDAANALKKALQMGADKAVHICDDAILGTDSLGTSLLAERLGLPQVTFASELTIAGTTVTMRRDGDAASETVVATMPALVSVTDQINEPRYPSFKGIMAAKKKTVETWSLADLGIDPANVGTAGAYTTVLSATKRPPREQGQIVTDEGDGGTKLAEFLSARKFI